MGLRTALSLGKEREGPAAVAPAPRPGKRCNKLWQRIFVYTLLLVVLSQLATFLLFWFTQDRQYRQKWLQDYVGSLAATLGEEDKSAAVVFLRHINRSDARMWFEDERGNVVLGEARAGFTFAERKTFPPASSAEGPVTIIDTPLEGRTTFCIVPVRFASGNAWLCYAFPGYDSSTPIQDLFYQGMLALCVVGGLLSFWVARSVARPLYAMRAEALEIAGDNLEKRVTLQGYDEIIDMGEAINKLTENLVRHLTGMRMLLANISHELRSPLTRMGLYAAMAEEGIAAMRPFCPDPLPPHIPAADPVSGESPVPIPRDAALENLHLMQEEMAQLENIIGVNLLLSRLDLQRENRGFMPLLLSELGGEMLRRYGPVFASRKLRVRAAIEPDLWARGDETLLRHTLTNLLDNAVKYTEEGGLVDVRLERVDHLFGRPGGADVRLSIENPHAPLAEQDLERVFEPFYRAAGIATGGGVGLGLALVRRIVTLHGGGVEMCNASAAGVPAVRVSVWLPLETVPEQSGAYPLA